MAVWIAIHVGYILGVVYAPFYFKKLIETKWKKHVLHITSLLAGALALLIPSLLTLGLGGYSPVDTRFPPIVCFARNRGITAYTLLIPLGILMATILTELILILHRLIRYILNIRLCVQRVLYTYACKLLATI